MTSVLHLTYGLSFGGVEKHLELIARHGGGGGYDHRFAALAYGGSTAEVIRTIGRPVTVLGFDPHRRPFATVAALLRLLAREQPHIVHCHGGEANLLGLPLARLAGVPIRVGEEIGIPNHGAKAKFAYGTAFRSASRVIGVSDAVRQWLVSSGEVAKERTITLYNPVGMTTYPPAPARRHGEPLRVISVGRIDPIKNMLSLIEAVALVRDRGRPVQCLIVGDGTELAEAERLVAKRNLADVVTLCGFVANPASLLASGHLYVQPSISEGLGIAIIEALAAGLPAAVTPVGGTGEIVAHGRTGWLLDDVSPFAIARTILIAEAMSGSELAAMGHKGREEVRDRFAPDRYMRALEDLYEELSIENSR
jgi:glycosyltransferase involved in cell wall biosynthesis